jgi:hypothetical protein
MTPKSRSMAKFAHSWLMLTLLFVTSAAICAAQSKIGAAAPFFSLSDQYDKTLQLTDLRGSLLVLIDADRTGNEFNGAWVRPLVTRYNTPQLRKIRVVQVAHLASAPGFMRNFIKGKFISKDSAHPNGPVLLDWQGIVAKSYGFHENVSNIYVVDAEGILRFTTSGKGASAELDPLFQLLDQLTAKPAPAAKPI